MLDFRRLSHELLRSGHAIRFRASGPSMAPAIQDGDLLTIDPGPCIRRGDVVLFDAGRGPTAHRVVGVAEPHELRVRGDAPGSDTEVVELQEVLGRVVRVERNGQIVGGRAERWTMFGYQTLRRVRRLVTRLTQPLLAPPDSPRPH